MFDKAKAYIDKRESELAAVRKAAERAARLGSRLNPKRGSRGEIMFSPDKSPRAVGHLIVETRPVDPTTGAKGEWKKHEDKPNLVVTQAENIMAQMAIGAANASLSYIELGDQVMPAPPALSDIGLQQSTGQRKAVTLTASGNIVTAQATWATTEGNGFNYTEAGLFNGLLGAGLMFARKTFATIQKTNAFEMRFTWYITFLVNTSGGDCAGVALVGPATVANFTVYQSVAGGEASVAATFDFHVNANLVDVFLMGQRLIPGDDYTEANTLNAPVGGPALNKGVNFNGFVLNPGDEVFLIMRSIQ